MHITSAVKNSWCLSEPLAKHAVRLNAPAALQHVLQHKSNPQLQAAVQLREIHSKNF